MKVIKRISIFIVALIAIFAIIFMLGPKPSEVQYANELPEIKGIEFLDFLVLEQNRKEKLRPGNGARIVWANDSLRNQTEYALVYLHGFSASPVEGDPIHEEFGKRYGMNTYIARLSGHGLDTPEPLINLDASAMLRSAEEALAIGKKLGRKVILMSCSTGSTLSMYLTSQFADDVHAQILYSPNIDVADPNSIWLGRPWGLQMARTVMGSKYSEWDPGPEAKNYWYAKYRLEGTVALKALINGTMKTENFKKITQPMLLSYYYKNDTEKDNTVSIDRMKEMFAEIATPANQKVEKPLPNVGHHCMASKYFSKDMESVYRETYAFAEGVLGLNAIIN